jgi:septum formation protein
MMILASNSPRRKELLSMIGWDYQVFPANIDEKHILGETPQNYVVRLAQEKANIVALNNKYPQVIVAADTTVADGNEILGKPTSAAEAMHMLQSLRGRVHQVFTGVAVLRTDEQNLLTDWCVTEVWMREYTDSEIGLYVDSGDPLDKAGAYAIQHTGFNPVQRWQGCYANVMGLPVCTLARMLEKMRFRSHTDVMQTCRLSLLEKNIVCRFVQAK